MPFESGSQAKLAGQKGGGKRSGAGRPSRYSANEGAFNPEPKTRAPVEQIRCTECGRYFSRPHPVGRRPITCPDGCVQDPVAHLRASILSEWELDPDDLALLDQVCSTMDIILDLRAIIRDEGYITPDGKVNPAVKELRAQRGVFRQLVKSMDLPNE